MSRLTDQLHAVVALYHGQAVAAAEAEAEHKRCRAKRVLKAMHDEETKAVSMAENIAEADDLVADLYSKRLITAAVADSTKQKIAALREEINMARSEMADRRVADEMHARDRTVV